MAYCVEPYVLTVLWCTVSLELAEFFVYVGGSYGIHPFVGADDAEIFMLHCALYYVSGCAAP